MVDVHGDGTGCGTRPSDGEVDKWDVADRAQGLGPQPRERSQAGARAGGKHDCGKAAHLRHTRGMEQRRWVNQTQPQTLQIAVLLLYFNGIITLVFGGLFVPFFALIAIGSIVAGYGIANERKWGYILGVGMALLPFALILAARGNPFGGGILNLIFEVALVALLLHPQSRDYQRIWFK